MEPLRVCYRGVGLRISITRGQMEVLCRDAAQKVTEEPPLEWPEELLPAIREKAEIEYQKVRTQIIANELEDAERREAAWVSTT